MNIQKDAYDFTIPMFQKIPAAWHRFEPITRTGPKVIG